MSLSGPGPEDRDAMFADAVRRRNEIRRKAYSEGYKAGYAEALANAKNSGELVGHHHSENAPRDV